MLLLLKILRVHRVELVDEVELLALFLGTEERVADVLDHLVHAAAACIDARALIDAREEGSLPIGRAAGRHVAGPQRDEARHVLVLRAEAVKRPGANAGPGLAQRTGVHENRRHVVRRNVRVTGADDRHVIHVRGEFGKNLAHFDARLERRGVAHAVGAGDGLAVVFGERRHGVPGVDVRRRALGEDVDDVFGLGGKMGLPGRKRIRIGGQAGFRPGGFGQPEAVAQQRRQAQGAEAHAEPVEELPPGEEEVLRPGGMVAEELGVELMWRSHTTDKALDGAAGAKVSSRSQEGIGKNAAGPSPEGGSRNQLIINI